MFDTKGPLAWRNREIISVKLLEIDFDVGEGDIRESGYVGTDVGRRGMLCKD